MVEMLAALVPALIAKAGGDKKPLAPDVAFIVHLTKGVVIIALVFAWLYCEFAGVDNQSIKSAGVAAIAYVVGERTLFKIKGIRK